MKFFLHTKPTALAAAFATLLALPSTKSFAHCDGLDGPVVTAARRALAESNVNLALIWVREDDEAAIKSVFAQTLAVRKLGAEAKELADTHFFETLVRVHRAGEGAPYTGLKSAGRDLGPAVPAADKALETGEIEPVLNLLSEKSEHGMREHFQAALAKRTFDRSDVAAGREFVRAYVEYVHYIEGLHAAITGVAHSHGAESAGPAAQHEAHATPTRDHDDGAVTARLKIPHPLEVEHEELHTELVKLLKVEGRVGDAARQVAKLLHAHFEKEEEFALPPLGLLPALASGKVAPEMNKALAKTDKLKAELPEMLAEHKAVVTALKQLSAAAEEAKNAEAARFAEKLTLHAQTEEQVLYPASILVGEFLKLTANRGGAR